MSSQQRERPVFLPNGVASPDGHFGVVANANGGVDALDLRTGETLWHCDDVLEPMLVLEGRVLARAPTKRADSMRIVEIDRVTGILTEAAYEFRFPEWTHFADPSRQDFECQLNADGKRLLLDWTVQCEYRGGAPAPQVIQAKTRKRIAGVSIIDTVTHESDTNEIQVLEEPPSRVSEGSNSGALGESVSYQYRGKWRDRPLRSTGQFAELTSVGDALKLNQWHPFEAQPSESVTLLSDSWFAPAVTADAAYVVVQSGAPGQPQGEWQIFSMESGEKVMGFQSDLKPERPCVIANRLYYLTHGPNSVTHLWSRDLSNGKVTWTKPLRGPKRPLAPPPLRK